MTQSLIRRVSKLWDSPPVWLALFIGLAALQARFLPVLNAGAAGRLAGGVLIGGGLALSLLAVVQFGRHRTTLFPRETPAAMIESGVYRLSRNPIYVADALILAGVALRWDLGALILVPLFMTVIQRRFILSEEAGLRATFGAAFEAYAGRTRRWL